MKKRILATLATSILAASILLTGCGSKETTKKYVIATDATYAPFEYQVDGKYTGIDIDILQTIAKEEGFEVEIKGMNFVGIIPAITSNQIDGAIAGMSITDARKKVLDFSEGYYDSGLALVGKAGTDLKSVEDLTGKTLAVKKGTAGAAYAEGLKAKYNVTLRYFDDSASMFQEVKNGNAAATFEDYPVIAYAISTDANSGLQIIGEKLTSVPYGFAVNKDKNEELLKKFDEGLAKIKANGEYDKIIAKYIK